MSEKLARKLIEQRVVDITDQFPVSDGDEYIKLALDLFYAGVYRIPIIGTKVGSNIVSLMLVSADIQEHAQLGKEIKLDQPQIAYTASIEGFPFNDTDPFLFYLQILTENEDRYQRFGEGSDFYSPSLNSQGLDELSRIFAHLGVFGRF
jgi:hypothetical protein